ncbi:MAG TPA: transketolase [Gammaproteobacteria bacterium]|nr:transketolase [Gammaproteobacteria bacterium]
MNKDKLEQIANILRSKLVETSHRAEVPHLGSCLSCLDILVTLYWAVLRIDPLYFDDPTRDRFILSKGHGAPALFQVLAMKSFFKEALLDSYHQDGSLFGEHPLAYGVPGIEAATGSLGHGLSIGIGLALGARIRGIKNRIYVLLSDGECNEGSIWEAALFASAKKLGRLVIIIDFNKWQATGRSEEIMAISPLKEKWHAFGWDAIEVDGHDMEALQRLLNKPVEDNQRPLSIVAHTIKGKGISFMEDNNNWHYRIPTKEEVMAAQRELNLIKEKNAERICG